MRGRLAAVAIISVVTAAGCSSGSATAASAKNAKKKPTAPAAQTSAQMLTAAIAKSAKASSYSADMSTESSGSKGSSGSDSTSMAGEFKYQKKPSPLFEFKLNSVEAGGQSMGSTDIVLTSQSLYMNMAFLSQALNTKPWLSFPLSSSGKSGLGSIMRQLQTSNPLSEAKLLAGVQDVRTGSTSNLDGVSVTEIIGSESVTSALANLPASQRKEAGQYLEQEGIGDIQFQAWVDRQDNFRQLIMTMPGSTATERTTITVTGINTPVSITVPPSGQVTKESPSTLSGSNL